MHFLGFFAKTSLPVTHFVRRESAEGGEDSQDVGLAQHGHLERHIEGGRQTHLFHHRPRAAGPHDQQLSSKRRGLHMNGKLQDDCKAH